MVRGIEKAEQINYEKFLKSRKRRHGGVGGVEAPFFYQFLYSALGGTIGKVPYVKVMGRNFHKPLPSDVNYCTDVIF